MEIRWGEQAFEDFRTSYPKNSGVSMNGFTNEFFEIALNRLVKHMDQ